MRINIRLDLSAWLIAILVMGMASPLLAATISIDTDCANNGDGTETTCAASGGGVGARNTWVGVSWSAGNTYQGKGGATANLTSFLIAGSGTAGSPITITSYGTGRHILNGVGSYGIATVNRSYITFDNVEVRSDTSHGIYFSNTGTSSNLIVTNCKLTNITGSGIQLGEPGATFNLDNVTITSNVFDTIGNAGVRYATIDAGGAANFDTHTITDNTFTAVGTASTDSAISWLAAGGTTATVTNLTVSRNTISNSNLADTSPAYAIRFTRTPIGSAIERIFINPLIEDNTITTTRMGGVFISHAYGGLLSGNTIVDNASNAGIAVFWSTDVVLERNDVSGLRPLAESSLIDGMGLDLEHNVNTTVRRNYIHDNLGDASTNNSGQGIYDAGGSYDKIYGNLLIGNKNGMQIDGGGPGGANEISNNTMLNSTQDGIWASSNVTKADHYQNNLVSGSARYGINDSGVTDQILNTNLFYNNAGGNYNSITAGATDLTSNPLLSSTYHLNAGSPARRAGSQPCGEYRGRACYPDRPDIGAYQSTSGDPAAPRTARQ